MADLDFPQGFIWGAATAAHQVEGDNTNCDMWALEHATPSIFKEPSGAAQDQWARFDDDVAILAALGLNAYRFGLEWARIEPEEGYFSRAALAHYQRCIDACLARGVTPVPTFQHFTLPLWQSKRGGFNDPKFSERFARYCEVTAGALKGFTHACTLNELNIPLFIGHALKGLFDGDRGAALKQAAEASIGGPISNVFFFTPPEAIIDQGMKAHQRGRDAIKAVHPGCEVGLTLSIAEHQAEPGGESFVEKRCAYLYDQFLDQLRGDDFIGVQTYTRMIMDATGRLKVAADRPRTQMGWEDRPEALAATVRYVWDRTKTPVFVTENGWAGHNDERRSAFIREALTALKAEIDAGANVRGYLYWSLLDNFEWMSGFDPRFGLIGVDRQTQRREIRASAVALGEIARRNSLAIPTPQDVAPSSYNQNKEGAQVGLG
ncbi:MAG: family 1 glycosylhydrolase [Terricaulis sp.]